MSVVISFSLNLKNINGEVVKTFEEIKGFSSDTPGYMDYKNNFVKIFDSLICKIDIDFYQTDMTAEIMNGKLSRAGRLLFRGGYRTAKDLQKKLGKIARQIFLLYGAYGEKIYGGSLEYIHLHLSLKF